MAALSRPYNGRPVTVQSAFAQQHGDPTGTRSSALSVFVPDALKTGRYDLRPDCYVHEITVDEHGRCKSAVYQDADGDFIEQEADIFILSCGAIESARLLLLSRSARFPAASQTAVTWWGETRLPRIQRCGGRVRRSDLCLGRRRLCGREQLPVLRA